MSARVLVTGGDGHVAGWAIAVLLERGYDVRIASIFAPSLRAISTPLGLRNRHSTAKAERVLGWVPRPARETVADCAKSLIARGAAS